MTFEDNEFLLKRKSKEIQVVVDNGYLKFADEDVEAELEENYENDSICKKYYSEVYDKGAITYDNVHTIDMSTDFPFYGLKKLEEKDVEKVYTGVFKNLLYHLFYIDAGERLRKRLYDYGHKRFYIQEGFKYNIHGTNVKVLEKDVFIFWQGNKENEFNEPIEIENLKEVPLEIMLLIGCISDHDYNIREDYEIKGNVVNGIAGILKKEAANFIKNPNEIKTYDDSKENLDNSSSIDYLKNVMEFYEFVCDINLEEIKLGSTIYFYKEKVYKEEKKRGLASRLVLLQNDKAGIYQLKTIGKEDLLEIFKKKKLVLKEIERPKQCKDKDSFIEKVIRNESSKIYANFDNVEEVKEEYITVYRNGKYIALVATNKPNKMKEIEDTNALKALKDEANKLNFVIGKYYKEVYDKRLKIDKEYKYLEKSLGLKFKLFRRDDNQGYILHSPTSDKNVYLYKGKFKTECQGSAENYIQVDINNYCDLYFEFSSRGYSVRWAAEQLNIHMNTDNIADTGVILFKKGLQVDTNNKLYAKVSAGSIMICYVIGPDDKISKISSSDMEATAKQEFMEKELNQETEKKLDIINVIPKMQYIHTDTGNKQVDFKDLIDKLGFIKQYAISNLYVWIKKITAQGEDINKWEFKCGSINFNVKNMGCSFNDNGEDKEVIVSDNGWAINRYIELHINELFAIKEWRDIFYRNGDSSKGKYYIEEGIKGMEDINKVKVCRYKSLICIIKKDSGKLKKTKEGKLCINIQDLSIKRFDEDSEFYWLYFINKPQEQEVDCIDGCTYYVEEWVTHKHRIKVYYNVNEKVFCIISQGTEFVDRVKKVNQKEPKDIKELLLKIDSLGSSEIYTLTDSELEELKKKAGDGEASKKN